VKIAGPSAEIDYGIMKVLHTCGEFFCAHRNYLFQIAPDGKLMSNTYALCADGIKLQQERLQNLPVAKYCWQTDQNCWWN